MLFYYIRCMKEQELLEYLEGFISEERKERFLEILEKRTNFITVAIEDLFKFHNTSAVIRSCEVFGVQEVHVMDTKNGEQLDKKIAMGAEQWVDVHRYTKTQECINSLKAEGYQIIATTPHENARLLADFKMDKKTALFFGTERDGLSDMVMQQADGFLKIPMRGFTESLNISVAAAIILQDLTEKLMKSDKPWELTDDQKFERRLDWTKKTIKSIDEILKRYTKNSTI